MLNMKHLSITNIYYIVIEEIYIKNKLSIITEFV